MIPITLYYRSEQREGFGSGRLRRQWRVNYPFLFDDDDVRLAERQPDHHYYEWLTAVVLFHNTGWFSLIEKYQFPIHKRKQRVISNIGSAVLNRAIRASKSARTQCPDLLVYAPDFSDTSVKPRVQAID